MFYICSDMGIERQFESAIEAVAWLSRQNNADDLWISEEEEEDVDACMRDSLSYTGQWW